jgi:hypothetical protein
VFEALHRRRAAVDAILYAFDLLELRALPLSVRKARLARLLRRKTAGIVFNEHTRTAPPCSGMCLQARARGHRVEAADGALSVRPIARLAQGEEPG